MTEKLSKRWLKAIDNVTGDWHSESEGFLELIAETDKAEQERDTLNVQNTMLILKWKTSEAFAEGTAKKLKEQLGIVENACQDWRDKAESAEAEVKALTTLLDKAWELTQKQHDRVSDASGNEMYEYFRDAIDEYWELLDPCKRCQLGLDGVCVK